MSGTGTTPRTLGDAAGIPLDLEAARAKMRAWTCEGCGDAMLGGPPEDRFCDGCTPLQWALARRSIPRMSILEDAGAPDFCRGAVPWDPDDWPRDLRPRASLIHPAADWPKLVVELVGSGQPGPRSVVLVGPNDVGKSHRAADLVVKLHREGVMGALWTSEADILAEKEFPRGHWGYDETPWPLSVAARTAPVVVVDDFIRHRGGPASIESALNWALRFAGSRWEDRTKVTIYTTHRLMSKSAARLAKQSTTGTVEAIAPAVFGRLKDGLVLSFAGRPGHRGDWAR